MTDRFYIVSESSGEAHTPSRCFPSVSEAIPGELSTNFVHRDKVSLRFSKQNDIIHSV